MYTYLSVTSTNSRIIQVFGESNFMLPACSTLDQYWYPQTRGIGSNKFGNVVRIDDDDIGFCIDIRLLTRVRAILSMLHKRNPGEVYVALILRPVFFMTA
jgi:hypothetical protein